MTSQVHGARAARAGLPGWGCRLKNAITTFY
jgi:hypothetical protein